MRGRANILNRPARLLAPPLLHRPGMPELPEDDERISKRVVYEHSTSSRMNPGIIIAIVVIAVALVVFILTHMH
ncbi:MAG: hypothetical protein JWN02_664 [Acidobacteria bacterium]|nr:hypothetical protein [Acidobacteriota bacterium]